MLRTSFDILTHETINNARVANFGLYFLALYASFEEKKSSYAGAQN